MLLSVLALLLVSLAMGAACSGSKGKSLQAKDAEIGATDGWVAVDTVGPSTDAVPRGSDVVEAAPMAREVAAGEVTPPLCTTFSDPCAAFVGALFRSKAWGSLMLGKQKWVWKFSDAGESGDYACQNGKIAAR